jgi:2-dehydropantoate 2-reductase
MTLRTIGIIGAGPVGGILAAHLSSARHTVILVDVWKEHLERIRSNGLRITGLEDLSAQPAHLLTSIRDLGDFSPELVFICTKACDLDNVLNEMSDALKKSSAVFVSFQNGIDTEHVVAERIDRSRILRGVVNYAGVLTGPGEIRESFFTPPNYLGWLVESGTEPCKEAAAVLSESGLATEATEDIGRHAWKKAILNSCTMSIAAITGMNMQEMINFPPTAQLVYLLLDESIAVAAAYGYDYGPEFVEKVRYFNNHAGPHRPSMRVDIENGRKTENPFIIRRIAEYAERKGVPAPLHRTVANLIDALEVRAIERHNSRRSGG